MRIDLGAGVVDEGGQAAGTLTALVFERESRRVAGFLVRVDGAIPREVFLRPGQVARVEQQQLTLTLTGQEIEDLPDAREHLYVQPGQEVEEEVAEAEAVDSAGDLAAPPDPDEAPAPTTIPGFPLLPGFTTPLEVERTAMTEDQITLGEGLRVVGQDGEEVGRVVGATIDDTRLVELVVHGDEELLIHYDLLDQLDEDANELVLTANGDELSAGDAEVTDSGTVPGDDASRGPAGA
jgi:hypothetical protein